MKNILILMLAVFGLATFQVSADETPAEHIRESGNDMKRGASKAVRDIKNSGCELVKGKMDCAGKKVENTLRNGADKIEDAID
jgi:hypothetical protein